MAAVRSGSAFGGKPEVGDIKLSLSPSAPWLRANGQEVSRTANPTLEARGCPVVPGTVASTSNLSAEYPGNGGSAVGRAYGSAAIYFNNLLIVNYQSQTRTSSNDGISFGSVSGVNGTNCLVEVNGHLFAGNNAGQTSYSFNGTTWTSFLNFGSQVHGVAYHNNTYFFALPSQTARNNIGDGTATYQSTNSAGTPAWGSPLISFNGYLYICGSASIRRSVDGSSWTTVQNVPSAIFYCFRMVGGLMLAFYGAGGAYKWSENGLDWFDGTPVGVSSAITDIAYLNHVWIVTDYVGNVRYSYDGKTSWQTVPTGFATNPSEGPIMAANPATDKLFIADYCSVAQLARRITFTRNAPTLITLPNLDDVNGVPLWIYGDPV